MKHIFTVLLVLTIISNAHSQIGKSYTEIHKQYPDSPETGLRNEGIALIEDIQLTPEEAMMVVYSKDSIVVGFGYLNDNGISQSYFDEIIKRELPKFQKPKTARQNGAVYTLDESNNYLTITFSQSPKVLFPLSNFMLMSDPKIISAWIKNVKAWE